MSVVVDSAVKNIVVEEFKRRQCVFVEGEDKEKLSRLMFDQRGAINPIASVSTAEPSSAAAATIPI